MRLVRCMAPARSSATTNKLSDNRVLPYCKYESAIIVRGLGLLAGVAAYQVGHVFPATLMGNPDTPDCQEIVRLSSVVLAGPRPHTKDIRQRPMDRRRGLVPGRTAQPERGADHEEDEMITDIQAQTRRRAGGIWRHDNFLKLWTGTTISALGSEITALAIPLIAALTLHASPMQMGLLGAMGTLPALLFGLLAGVWVDRVSRKQILLVTDVGRALLLASVPLASLLGILRIEYLFLVVFLVGTLSLFFDVAYVAYLPAILESDELLDGNSKLEVSASAAQMTGPGIGGVLVQVVTAPVAVLLDAISFLASALFIRSIRAEEPERHEEHGSARREIVEGLKVAWRDPVLRAMALHQGTSSFSFNLMLAVYMLYLVRDLHVPPGLIGLLGMGAGPGTLLGALVASRLPGRWGLGPTMMVFAVIPGLGLALMALAAGPLSVVVPLFMLGWALAGASSAYDINALSLRQKAVPQHLQGRINAIMHFIFWGAMPLGSLTGGFLGTMIGLQATVAVGAVGALLSATWIWFSPIRGMRE